MVESHAEKAGTFSKQNKIRPEYRKVEGDLRKGQEKQIKRAMSQIICFSGDRALKGQKFNKPSERNEKSKRGNKASMGNGGKTI